MMMARGMIVVDENLLQLVTPLRSLNIHVVTPESGWNDKKIAETLLVNRIFVTCNSKDFVHYAAGLSIGIIGLEGLDFTDAEQDGSKNITVQIISKAIIKHKIWSKKNGFFLELKENGKHKFQEF